MGIEDKVFLVTGGAGFIGSHLVQTLLAQGARKVIALDHLQYGSWRNLESLSSRQTNELQLLTLDFTQLTESELAQLFQGVDYLYHLAAEKHNQSLGSPDRVLDANVNGTYRLFHAATQAGVQKVIFTSSLYAYGSMTPPEMVETQIPKPHTLYGVSKLTGENLLQYFHETYKLRYTTLRLFFTYGPRQFAGMGYKSVIMKNFERILTGLPPTITGNGQQSLDYIYVSDVVRALILSLGQQADAETFNVGSGLAISVLELTNTMLKVANSDLAPQFIAPDWTAGSYRVSNSEKIRRLLHWEPLIPLNEGLSEVYRWMAIQKTLA